MVAAVVSARRNPSTTYRWDVLALLAFSGCALCVAALRLDARGAKGLKVGALFDLGLAVALSGLGFVLQGSLRADIRAATQPPVLVSVSVRHTGQQRVGWSNVTTAHPGDSLDFLIRFENRSGRVIDDVVVGDNLPKFMRYVRASTQVRTTRFPQGTPAGNENITLGGINVGSYAPDSVAYVSFSARVDPLAAFAKLGTYDLRNFGVVRPAGGNEIYNTSVIFVQVP